MGAFRLRWIGHNLHAETTIDVDASLSMVDAHAIALRAEHRLRQAIPRLTSATVHADPAGLDPDPHTVLVYRI